jgi:hypothetical protein
MKPSDKLVIKAVALCYKPYLKPEEGMIYCNLERTRFLKRCDDFGIYKNNSGYFKRADLDMMMSGAASPREEQEAQMRLKFK